MTTSSLLAATRVMTCSRYLQYSYTELTARLVQAGMKKMEYKTRQWHERCFVCCVCSNPIGTKSFIPKENDIYCTSCYEDKFATKCVKCGKVIKIFIISKNICGHIQID